MARIRTVVSSGCSGVGVPMSCLLVRCLVVVDRYARLVPVYAIVLIRACVAGKTGRVSDIAWLAHGLVSGRRSAPRWENSLLLRCGWQLFRPLRNPQLHLARFAAITGV